MICINQYFVSQNLKEKKFKNKMIKKTNETKMKYFNA